MESHLEILIIPVKLERRLTTVISGDAGFSCVMCDKTFVNMDLLQQHVRIHQMGTTAVKICKGKFIVTCTVSYG